MIWRKPLARKLTGVSATLEANHRNAAGDMHSHTWDITVWCSYSGDAILLRWALDRLLEPHQGKCLPDAIAWAENLAAWIAAELASEICQPAEVEINRTEERLHAKWIAPHSPKPEDR